MTMHQVNKAIRAQNATEGPRRLAILLACNLPLTHRRRRVLSPFFRWHSTFRPQAINALSQRIAPRSLLK
jgi:hypothetical protein